MSCSLLTTGLTAAGLGVQVGGGGGRVVQPGLDTLPDTGSLLTAGKLQSVGKLLRDWSSIHLTAQVVLPIPSLANVLLKADNVMITKCTTHSPFSGEYGVIFDCYIAAVCRVFCSNHTHL